MECRGVPWGATLTAPDCSTSPGGTQTVELYDYFYPFTPPPDESRQETAVDGFFFIHLVAFNLAVACCS